MTDGRYVFRNCVPEGALDIAKVAPGEILNRSWSFRVNSPPELQSALDNGMIDPRNVLQGHKGQLFDGDGNFLAAVNTWNAQLHFTNTDYHPAGSKITWSIPTSYTVTLTFTETLVQDAILLAQVMAALADGSPDAVLNFQGVLRAGA